jgi:hypothetical protein
MQIFTSKVSLEKRFTKPFVALLMLLLISFTCFSQIRNYSLVYSENLKGGSTIFGNTLMNIITNKKVDTAKMNDNRKDGNSSYGN